MKAKTGIAVAQIWDPKNPPKLSPNLVSKQLRDPPKLRPARIRFAAAFLGGVLPMRGQLARRGHRPIWPAYGLVNGNSGWQSQQLWLAKPAVQGHYLCEDGARHAFHIFKKSWYMHILWLIVVHACTMIHSCMYHAQDWTCTMIIEHTSIMMKIQACAMFLVGSRSTTLDPARPRNLWRA